MNIRIYNYNNYYNRIVKKMTESSPEYGEYIYEIQNTNFNPNDGVATEHKFGNNTNSYDGTGDYLICMDQFNTILSRWFIVENKRERGGQWTTTLKRDVVVDYYDDIINAPCFIEKAILPSDNKLIFNSENISFNQIKKGEYLIENKLKTPWVVAYLARTDGTGNYNSFSGEFRYERAPQNPNYILNSVSDYEYYKWINDKYLLPENITFRVNYYAPNLSVTKYMYMMLKAPGSFTGNYTGGYEPGYELWPKKTSGNPTCSNPTEVYNSLMDAYNNYDTVDISGLPYNSLTNFGTINGFNELASENGKIIQAGSKYYRIKTLIEIEELDYDNKISIPTETTLYNKILNDLVVPSGLSVSNNTVMAATIVLPYEVTRIRLELEEVLPGTTFTYNFSYTKAETTDAVYEIIATPLYDTTFTVSGGTSIKSIGTVGLQWFQALKNNEDAKVYDVQIVPYIEIDDSNINSYNYITSNEKEDSDAIGALAIQIPRSSFNLLLEVDKDIKLNPDVKIGSETELWRITSPNGVGNFDFNPYKNTTWNFVEVDCTLLPINPYIKIAPLFNPNGLYGGDYNDFRGLICGGDFSVALTNNDWAAYQQQNKNYLNSFNREIESMELKNKIGLTQDIVGAFTGVGSGAAAGALAGSVAGPYGAIAGAVVGGVSSAVGGAADIFINQKLRTDALDLTKDQFGYNLENIQARPITLARTTAYNINNKYFPYIEFFRCTDEEIDALVNKIRYNGMTVMTIGKISDYIDNTWTYNNITEKSYIKGKIIRLENIKDDFHITNDIANEIHKGVFV